DAVDHRLEACFPHAAGQPVPALDVLRREVRAMHAGLIAAEVGDPRFNSIWTLAGTPCVTLPSGSGAKGLPLGLQLVGLRHEDNRLLSTAAWVAAHLD
ncbi:MAG TPA: hypothetical protein VK777_04205, partial [Reyranella sp.]|nr:hypothetical protein [Reyranella sp.]